jgi:hypothetical protein
MFRLVKRGYSVLCTKRCAAGGRSSVEKRGTNFMVSRIAW